ncbi:winged helix-turn-helix transcriptional regulator [Haloarchaeobius iranensis]|uniref:Predicted transcriptional regulator, containsd two HTH domains n=1 Tax=Haloarchaeobius iranensis TaxID=996166 RepID=A0A1G9X0P9_9EURY|nr:MarR family transcriptional regulator [Haloarchaeobius iranensis]SDM89915.1 Predicted transcriptional regulator, containsd two HTH domains [Haloarchaeobius iranensis]
MGDSSDVDERKRATLKRFAAVGAASPFARFADVDSPDTGENEVRDAITGYLTATPGAHFSKLRDDLKLGTGETQHHLRRLADDGSVEVYRDGDYKRLYPAGRFTDFEKRALGYLRRETPRGMLVELLRTPEATGSHLADVLDVSRPTVSKYAGELDDAGLLSREQGYRVERPETVLMLVVRYADSFDENAAGLAAEADSLVRFDG